MSKMGEALAIVEEYIYSGLDTDEIVQATGLPYNFVHDAVEQYRFDEGFYNVKSSPGIHSNYLAE